eukprot:m.26176 g.26176  ORF g.26176 m.26176 type:complete len:387 (-) comp15296_c0_seq2:466-1626(-)
MDGVLDKQSETANEHMGRLRTKRREDGLAACGSGRRHKERQALGTINSNVASSRVLRSAPACAVDQPLAQSLLPVAQSLETTQNAVEATVSTNTASAAVQPTLPESFDLVAALQQEPMPVTPSDPHSVAEYVQDIFTYLHGIETKFMAKPRYMRKQRDINHSMRSILVDWLVEVSQEYRLDAQTLFIAVSYIDRFLSEMSVQRGKLQLVGVTAMLLASKYEEIYPPAVDEFVYITDNTYSREQILKMEHLILKVLKFDMGGVTAYSFFQRFIKMAQADDNVKYLTMYLMELTLQDGERFLKYTPSIVAASALAVAQYTVGQPCWPDSMFQQSGFSTDDIKESSSEIFYAFVNAARNPQQAVREKYSHSKFLAVSSIPPPPQPPTLE